MQLVVFQYGAAVSTFDNQTLIAAKELRLFNSPRPTPDQLNQTGSLDALLVGDTLTFSGPSGLGFQVIGSWSATDDGGMPDHHTFTASGTMVLATAVGTINFASPDDNPLTITTIGNLTADFGTVTGIQWSTDQVLNSTDLNNPLSTFQNTFGLGIDTGLVQLDVKLGADLGALGAPLNHALPYIYVTTPTANTAQFGDTVATIGDGNPLTVALDPRDPFLYAQANEFTVGGSLQGYIPYTPVLPVQGLNGHLYGHLYGLGTVQPGDVPVTLSGAAVLNLDAAGDGQLLANLQGNVAGQLLTGQLALSDFAQSAPQDLQAGFNGAVMLPYAAAGFALALNGNGSAVYAPGQISVHATATPDLFNGTPLNIVVLSSPVDVTATYDNQGNVDIIATAATGTVVGLDASAIRVELNNAGVTVTAHLNAVPALGPVDVQGPVSPNGQFTLTGSVNATLAGFPFSGTLTLSPTGAALAGQVTIPGLGTVAMTGSLNAQGQFQLTGSADITVAGFSLPRTIFTLTNSGMTAAALLTLPGLGSVALSGTIGVNGQISLTGTASLTIGGFQVTATFTLTNSGLTVSGTVNIPGLGQVTLTGTVDLQGNISLTGTATVNVPGFGQVGLMITLTNSGITVKATLNIPGLGMVMLMGTLDAQGNFSLTGTATVNIPGFGQVTLMLTLTNNGLTVKATINIPGLGMVMFMGTIDTQGNFSLTGTATVNIPGFGQVTLMLTLTNNGLTAKATINIPGIGMVMLMGTINAQGNFVLTGTVTVTIAGFQVMLTVTLTNNGITISGKVTIPGLGMVMLTGTIDGQGNIKLTGTVTVTIAGFQVTLMVMLTNAGLTVTGTLNIPGIGQVTLTGSIDAQGNFVLKGTATVNIPGFGQVTLMLTLTNNGLAVKATLNIPGIGMVMLMGTLDAQGNFTLTGTATVNIPGFGQVTLMITVTNAGITVKATLNIPGLGMVMFMGTIDAQGNFVLTGTATVNIPGFGQVTLMLTLTNAGISVKGTLNIPGLGMVMVTGTINAQGNFTLTGTATVNIPGLGQVTLMITVTNTGISVKATVNIPGLGMVMFMGTIDAQGNFTLTGTATVNIPGFGQVTLMLTLTNNGLTVKATINIPGIGMVMVMGAINAQGNFVLTGTVTVNIAGFQVMLTVTLTNNGITISGKVTIPGLGMVMLTGTIDGQGNIKLTGTVTVTIAGFQVTLMVMLTNAGITVTGTLNIPGIGQVILTGSIDAQGNFVLKGTVTVTIAGFSASATLTLTNSGLSIQVTLGVLFMGLHPQLAGQINSNGAVSLDGTAQVTLDTGRFGPLPLNLGFHMDNQSLRAHVAGNVNWVFQGTGTFTLQGSFGIDFVVRSDGSFVSAGNFMAVECFNGNCSAVPVPFNIDNHVFIIHAPPPFGDVVMQYPMPGAGAPGGGFPAGKAATFTFSAGATAIQLPHVHSFIAADTGLRTVSVSPLTAATAVSGAAGGESSHLTDAGARGGRHGAPDRTLGTAVDSPESFTMFATAWALAGPATPKADAAPTGLGAVAGGADPSAKVVALPPTGSPPFAEPDHLGMDVLPADWESILPGAPLADEMIRALIV